jgi:hypothetical protein
MRITPRRSVLALLACSIAACSSFDHPSQYPSLKAPAESYCKASERLRDEIREYLKEEDRWIPRGRDISLWQSAELLGASGRNLNEGLTNNKLTSQELAGLVATATRRFKDLEYWTANVRINETIHHALSDVQIRLNAIQRNSRAKLPAQPKSAPSRRTQQASIFAPSQPFSPNDLDGAVRIAKNYLAQKYGIKNEAIGNMRAHELSNHHEVTLETHTTSYVLLVDVHKGSVTSEKSSPKSTRRLAATR